LFQAYRLLLPFNTGPFNWHCHILSHEDHEMMRAYYVGSLPSRDPIHNPELSETSVNKCSKMTAEGCEQIGAVMSISSSVLKSGLKSILMLTIIKAWVAAAAVVMEW
jgi:hypothetical protein